MATTVHTFEFFGPTDDTVEQFTGYNTINSTSPDVRIRKVVEIEDSILADAKLEYESKQWIYIGVGDQTASPVIELYRTSPLTTGNAGALIDVPWDGELFKTDFDHSTSAEPENILVKTSGTYQVFGSIKFTSNLDLHGIRVVLLVNEVPVLDQNTPAVTGETTSAIFHNSLNLLEDDIVKVQIASLGTDSVSVVTDSVSTYLKLIAL